MTHLRSPEVARRGSRHACSGSLVPLRHAHAVGVRGMEELPREIAGWWRITETSQWMNDDLDILGPALLSLTEDEDRLRMHCLLAHVTCKPTKTGVSFTWEGAWEYDQLSGSGSAKLGRDDVTVADAVVGVSPASRAARARRSSRCGTGGAGG